MHHLPVLRFFFEMGFDIVLADEMRPHGRFFPTSVNRAVHEYLHPACNGVIYDIFALLHFSLLRSAVLDCLLHAEDTPDWLAFRSGEGGSEDRGDVVEVSFYEGYAGGLPKRVFWTGMCPDHVLGRGW